MLALSHTHYSLRQSTIKPDELVKQCKEYGYSAVGIIDNNGVAGAVELFEACKKHEIKPVLGAKLNLCRYATFEDFFIKTAKETGHSVSAPARDNKLDSMLVLAKNLEGWKSLLMLITTANDEQSFDFKHHEPRLDISLILDLDEQGIISLKDLVFVVGGEDSSLQNNLFADGTDNLLVRGYESILKTELEKYKVFPNVIYGIDNITERDKITRSLLDGKIDYKFVNEPYFLTEKDEDIHQVLICTNTSGTLKEVSTHKDYKRYFSGGKRCLIPSEKITEETIPSGLFEEYEILSPPKLPKFECPEHFTDDEYLIELCRGGYKNVEDKLSAEPAVYGARVKKEMSVITEYRLSSYFLIVRDIIQWCTKQGWLTNVRGSAAGSLVSYLIGITYVDPIKYGLIFERFMNEGRMSKDKISLPDIDTDVPGEYRDDVISYISNKYGESNVAQLATFGRLQGRASCKAVLRAHQVCSPQEMDSITKNIPDEAEISDELAELEDKSIIEWAINNVDELKSYASYEDGKLVGEYAEYFKQAIRLEGTYSSMGKHAAAVILCEHPIYMYAPLIRDTKGGSLVVGMDMHAAEKAGLVKLDILSLDLLSKLMYINKLLMGEIV